MLDVLLGETLRKEHKCFLLSLLMIATSCDILQDTFSSVTKLSRPVKEPNVRHAHVIGCIVLLCVRVESSPVLGVPM
jgi:hypothetical protein